MTRKYFPFCFYVLVSVLCLGKPSSAYPSGSLGGGGAIPAVDASSETDSATIDSITPLKIGDKIPDELWDYAFPIVSPHSDQVQYLALGDFRDKLIILDFWATWCGTCLKFMPGLDSIQNSMEEIVQIVPVSKEREDRIKAYFQRAEIKLPSIINDQLLKDYFPHNYLPYQVWVKNGVVFAFTEPIHVTVENIKKVYDDDNFILPQRYDNVHYDLYSPLIINGNGDGPETIRYQSTITGFLDGVNGQGRIVRDTVVNINKVILPNMTIKGLYTFIIQYEDPALRRPNRIIYETSKKGTINLTKSPNWYPELRKNFYSLELIYPTDDRKKLSRMVRQDLNRYFEETLGIKGQIEKRMMKCWVLTHKNNNRPAAGTDGEYSKEEIGNRTLYKNFLLKSFFNELNAANRDSEIPFIDLTEKGVKVDLDMPSDLKDLAEVRASLNKHGLELMERDEMIDVLVFKDVNK